MRTKLSLVTVVVLGLCAVLPLAKAEEIPLKINIDGTITDTPYPIRAGVPFAQGKLKDQKNVKLEINGKEIELQTRILAYWSDKSIKWLLLDFYANDGQQAKLIYGNGVSRKQFSGVKTTATTDSITMENSSVKFTVNKNGCGFIDSLYYDKNGNGKFENDEQILKPNTERRYVLDYLHRPKETVYNPFGNHMENAEIGKSKVEISELKLEESGPIRSTILIRGRHKITKLASRIADQIKTAGGSDFSMRIHLYKNDAVIMAEPHFVFDGIGDDDFVKAWAVNLSLEPGMNFSTVTPQKNITLKPNADAPFTALTQTSADAFKIWQADANRMGETIAATGERSSGWVDISNNKWGVSLGTRWFWERWPNAIHYDSQSGKTSIMLYPPEAGPMDLRRYARREFGVGETGAPEYDIEYYAPFSSRGTANRKIVRIAFHKGKTNLSGIEKDFQAFNIQPLATAPAQHYRDTLVFGEYVVKAEGEFSKFEGMVTSRCERAMKAQEDAHWYGMWSFGDIQSRFAGTDNVETHREGRFENDWGRWAWAHGDGAGRIDRAFLFQYIRTGDRKYFDMGEANSTHRMDADIIESKEVPWDASLTRKIPPERTKGPWWDLSGCAHRHGVQHWSGFYIGARGGNIFGQRMLYYLTGDGRALDMLEIAKEMGMTYLGADGRERVAQRLGSSGGSDGLGTALWAILAAWERTGEDKYMKALAVACTPGNPVYGHTHPEGNWNIGMSSSFGTYQAIDEYRKLSKDPNAIEIAEHFARELLKANHRNWMWPGSFHDIANRSATFTGKPEYAKLTKEMINEQLKKGGVGFNTIITISRSIEAAKAAKNEGEK